MHTMEQQANGKGRAAFMRPCTIRVVQRALIISLMPTPPG